MFLPSITPNHLGGAMARIRSIRRCEGVAVSVGVGLVLLLAAPAWRRLDPPGDAPGDESELLALEAACVAKLHREARTAPMPPDAAAGPPERPVGVREAEAPVLPFASDAGPQAPSSDPPEGSVAGRRLRLTDYGWAARNTHLRNDACTRFYRRKLALGR